MASSGDMPMGGRSTLRPPRAADNMAQPAGSATKSKGKPGEPEPGAVPGVFGGTGNSEKVGGGRKKGQGPTLATSEM